MSFRCVRTWIETSNFQIENVLQTLHDRIENKLEIRKFLYEHTIILESGWKWCIIKLIFMCVIKF